MDDVEEHLIAANERLGDALVQIGMALGLPRPTAQYHWGAPQIMDRIAERDAEIARLRAIEIAARELVKPVPGWHALARLDDLRAAIIEADGGYDLVDALAAAPAPAGDGPDA